MALWMGYALLVGALVAVAAQVAEWALRSRGRPGRHAWTVAFALSLILPVVALLRPAPSAHTPALVRGATTLPIGLLVRGFQSVPAVPSLLERAEPWLVGLWALATLLLGGALVGGLVRLSLRARRWPSARSESGEVLLSDGFGPAVLGLGRSRVVLPRWTLRLAPGDLRLVLLHEEEHRQAGDARVLLTAALAVVAAPWNAALWWQLRRLRAAVELDCDARVLARGASPAAYGALLLELGTHLPGLPLSVLPVAALSQPPSLLERRLRMIVRGVKRQGRTKALAAAGAVVLLLALACEAPAPTGLRSADDEGAAAQPADGAATVGAVVAGTAGEDPIVFVDGVRQEGTPSQVLKRLDRNSIQSVEVVKGGAAQAAFGADGAHGVIQIRTKDAVRSLQEARERTMVLRESVKDPSRLTQEGRAELKKAVEDAPWTTDGDMPLTAPRDTTIFTGVTSLGGRPHGTVTLDGKPFHGDLSTLDATTIDHIEVIKGGKTGSSLIKITTKKAARGGREEK